MEELRIPSRWGPSCGKVHHSIPHFPGLAQYECPIRSLGFDQWLLSLSIFLDLSVQFSSATQLCPTLCDPIDCSTPGFPSITNSRGLLKFMSIESVMLSNHLEHIYLSRASNFLEHSFPQTLPVQEKISAEALRWAKGVRVWESQVKHVFMKWFRNIFTV